jgi:hypothetical protein
MVYFSLILSLLVFVFVVRLMTIQRRFDLLNGITVTGALIVVLLDIDTIISGRNYPITSFLSLGVLLLWIFNLRRAPLND